MTHHKFVTRSGSRSVHDNEEELLKDKRLLVLLESFMYCTKNQTAKIRYTQLKKLCNNKLAHLTGGRETDFGGTFEKFILEFECIDNPNYRLVERQKIRHRESYIIPDIQRIRNHFAKRDLLNLIVESPTFFKATESKNHENKKLSSILGIGEIPEDGDKEPIVKEYKLYNISYYYDEGRPIFVENHDLEEDSSPFL